MRQVLFVLLMVACTVFCQEAPTQEVSKQGNQKYLHISTIPSNTDVFINQVKPDHTKNPSATSSTYIPIAPQDLTDNQVLISLFKPEFIDTTIRVTLSEKDTSFLIVSMRPTYDDELKKEQKNQLKKRYNRNFGRKMIFGSFVPLAVSAVSGIVTYNEIKKAEETKKSLKKNLLGDSENFNKEEKKFKSYQSNAETAHTVMNVGVSLGLSLLAVGIILSF